MLEYSICTHNYFLQSPNLHITPAWPASLSKAEGDPLNYVLMVQDKVQEKSRKHQLSMI